MNTCKCVNNFTIATNWIVPIETNIRRELFPDILLPAYVTVVTVAWTYFS
jgi:hypothetical protein